VKIRPVGAKLFNADGRNHEAVKSLFSILERA